MSADRWQDRAACAGVQTVVFFPERGESSTAAKATCQTCPVRLDCLNDAVERGEKTGVHGGAGGDLLRAFRRAHRHRPHPDLLVEGCDCPWCQLVALHFERLDTQAAIRTATETGDQVTAARLRRDMPPPPERFGPGARHGLRVTYNRGCSCEPCTLAAAFDTAGINPTNPRGATA